MEPLHGSKEILSLNNLNNPLQFKPSKRRIGSTGDILAAVRANTYKFTHAFNH